METSKMNFRIRQLTRPSEELGKTCDILKRIEQNYSDNKPLIRAVDNSLFRHILAAIELLRPDLEFTTDPRYEKNKKHMKKTVRYDIDLPKGRRKALLWVEFPSGKSEFNTVKCRLQKFSYTSPKVELSGPTDAFDYPTLNVHDFPDIDELIGCLNEAIPKI